MWHPVAHCRFWGLLLFALGCVAPASVAQRVVDFSAEDGTVLKATFFASGKPGPGVLLLHQCNRQRKVWDGLATKLAGAGINVLTFDYRGFGESGGEPYDKLLPAEAGRIRRQKWPGDIDTAFHFLVSQPGVRRDLIGVGGASCGVDISVQIARQHPEVRSLVLLSGPTDLSGRQFLRHSAEVPVLFAVADDDEFPPTLQVMEWLYSLTSNPGKRLVHYEKGGHGADMFAVHPELPGIIVDWYRTTLIKTPGRAPVSSNAPAMSQQAHALDLIDQAGGPAEVRKMLEDARQRNREAELFPEAIVNLIGYEHMQSGDIQGAIEILKVNVFAFPNSPNVYDSVSDAYLAAGQKDLARQNAKKALQLLSSDTADDQQRRDLIRDSAEQKLKRLGDAP